MTARSEHEAPGDAARERIEGVLASGDLSVFLQPVVDLRTGAVVGAEALARFPAEPVRPPDVWFAEAWAVGRGIELELFVLRKALGHLRVMPEGAYLAINLAPPTLLAPALEAVLSNVPAGRVVLELTEHARVDNYDAIAAVLAHLRARGVRLAVDDAGAGFASFHHILQLRPDVIKLDRTLTRSIDCDPMRAALAAALVAFAAKLGVQICAEGIETAGELSALQRLGVPFGQGYLLGSPAPALLPAPARASGGWRPLPRHQAAAATDAGASLSPGSLRGPFEGEVPSTQRPVPLPPESPALALLDPARLAALHATGLLDSDAEEAFDRFTRLASQVLHAPIALVSLVDAQRQFFKSAIGLPEPWATCRQTPLSHSFCKHVVSSKAPLVVDDARAHPLVHTNLAIDTLGVIAYAGMPLTTADDQTLGALCVIEHAPRVWTDAELQTLRQLAAAVVTEIELRRALRRLREREALFRAIFEQAALGVLLCNEAGRILRVNTKLCSLLGYREQDLRGEPVGNLEHPEDQARDRDIRSDLLAGKRDELQVETRYLTRNRTWRWMRETISVARDSKGELAFTVALIEDIEDARRTKEDLRVSEERYRALVRNLPNTSVVLFDRQLRFVLADGDQLFATIGTSREQLEGRTLAEVSTAENLAVLTEVYQATLAGHRGHVELAIGSRCLEIHTTPVRDNLGHVTNGMVMTYDITALKKTESALRDQTAAIGLLEEIATAANQARTSREAFQHALTLIGARMAWSVGHVFVRDSAEMVSSGLWHVIDAARTATFVEATRTLRIARGVGLIGGVFAAPEAVRLFDVDRSMSFLRYDAAAASGLTRGFVFPILVGAEVVAIFEFYGTQAVPPNGQTIAHTGHISAQLARVVERERHAAALQSLSVRDELTGLFNRRGFLELGRQQQLTATRGGRPFALLFADLDGLKPINDKLGHEVGDDALRQTAALLRDVFREADLIARLGGDEFVVLAVDAENASAESLELRVRRALAAFNAEGGRGYHLALSVGIARFDPGAPQSLDALLEEADSAMYVQKRAARANNVLSSSAALPPNAGAGKAADAEVRPVVPRRSASRLKAARARRRTR